MSTCQGKTKDGRPCSRRVKDDVQYCRWHAPGTSGSWREVYERLAHATPEEKTDIVLRLIEEHPRAKLELPEHDGIPADLNKVNLSPDTLKARLERLNIQSAPWWDADTQSIRLREADLRGAKLGGAELKDSILQEADLQGTYLAFAILRGANLAFANLQDARLNDANLQKANLVLADFQNAFLLRADLRGATLDGANFQGATLISAKLQRARLWEADLQNVKLREANLQDADLRSAKLQGVDLSQAEITHIYISGAWLDKTRLRREQLGGAIGEELTGEFGLAKQGYLTLKQNFDDLGDYDAASWAYRKERRMEKWEALRQAKEALAERRWWLAVGNSTKVVGDQFIEVLCDYGESAWRVIAWMAALLFVVGPALLGLLGGLNWTDSPREICFSFPTIEQRWAYAYFQYVLYMLDTFTTANFSELIPANDLIRLFSGFMAILGIFLAGLLGFVAGNRIRRS